MIFEDSRTYTAKSLRSDRQRIYSFSKTGTANNEYSNILQLFNSYLQRLKRIKILKVKRIQ